MKGFLCCKAFHSADETLRKRIRDYSNTESIFPSLCSLPGWKSQKVPGRCLSLPPTTRHHFPHSCILCDHRPPPAVRASCPMGSPSFLTWCFSACPTFPWWCFLASALSTHRGPNQAPSPLKDLLEHSNLLRLLLLSTLTPRAVLFVCA